MKILDIKDKYNSDIVLNDRYVYSITQDKIQVEHALLKVHSDNSLYILFKEFPTLCTTDIEPQNQKVDLPIELIEVLILGMAVKAYGMGALTNDPRTGTSYVQNPYIDRYELAIKKAIDSGYLHEESIQSFRSVSTKGFI